MSGVRAKTNFNQEENGMGTEAQELPKYNCHKQVQAIKIGFVETLHDGGAKIIPCGIHESFTVDAEYVRKHVPEAGGYYVVYEGGYKSFSPAQAFEEGYSLVRQPDLSMSDQDIEQEIQDKGLTAPRITPQHIEQMVVGEEYHRFPHTTVTVCCLFLHNGFTVVGESACASSDNFDEELGKKIARDNAKQKIWALEGYLLKQKLHEQG